MCLLFHSLSMIYGGRLSILRSNSSFGMYSAHIVKIGSRVEGFARFGGAPNLAGDPQRGAQNNLSFMLR
jgi:hypothetical protein